MAFFHARFLSLLLIVCALGALAGLVAFGLGEDAGAFLILAMMAVATFPLFHFASRWPLKKEEGSVSRDEKMEDE